MLPSKFKTIFIVILIGLISLTLDAAWEMFLWGQGSLWDSLTVLIPKYKIYSRMILLLSIIALGGFIYTYFDHMGSREKDKGERLQASIFASIQDGLCILDNDFHILRVNPTMEKWYPHALPLMGKKCYEAFHGRSEPCEVCPSRRTLETGEATMEVVTKTGPHGEAAGWLDLYSFPLLDADTGKIKGAIEYIRDITARKKAEELLQESEKRYKMLFESAPDAILIMEAEGENSGRIVAANQAAAEMHGYSVPEILELNISALNPRAKTASGNSRLRRILAGEWIQEEITHLRKDGTAFPVEIHAGLMELEDHKYILAFDRDISERKQGEEALREAHQTLHALIQASPLAIFVLDPEARVRLWNPAAEHLFGWREEEVLGRTLPSVPPTQVKESKRLFQRMLAGESLDGLELQRQRKDGSPIYISIFTAPLYDVHGQITGIMALNSDITESKRLKEQLLQSQKMEVVGRLAGGVAHDFNNLLTAITGYSELVLNFMDEDNPLRQDVAEIRKAGDRAASLTRQLLAFSRKQVLQPKVLDLNKVVESMGKMLQRLLPSDIDLTISQEQNLGRVMADPGQIEQVILNLAINARDAMPQGGRLTLTTANVYLKESQARRLVDVEPGHYVMLMISDTGCGMDPETRSHIFEPFFTTKEMGKGTGLGLSTVYGIVKQSGGHISVHSQPGEGATFKVYLPRISGVLEPATQASPESTTEYRGQETILLVEDEDGVRQLVSTVLKRHGFKVLEASHGGDALQITAEHSGPIHLVLTDVVMPGIGGQELAQRLKPLHPDLKVLYMSGYADYSHLHQDLPDQEIYYLQKPFEAHALLQRVRELLDAPA
jgi:two-component system cell cycle sensor histidine kinase/response regulator CckA